jgi:hypothetical protein
MVHTVGNGADGATSRYGYRIVQYFRVVKKAAIRHYIIRPSNLDLCGNVEMQCYGTGDVAKEDSLKRK